MENLKRRRMMDNNQQKQNVQKVKLTSQAARAIMMAVQVSMKDQMEAVDEPRDAGEMIQNFELTHGRLQDGQEGLIVLNPPVLQFKNAFGDDQEEVESDTEED